MNWTGRIHADDRTWGPGGGTLLLAGDPAAPADTLPGRLIPDEMLHGDGALLLPDLGGLPARDRLALAGFQSLNPRWDGVAIVPGDAATLWLTLSAGEVIHLQRSATPRLVAALGLPATAPTGMAAAMDRPEKLPLLLADATGDADRLGALMGAEVGATRSLWLGQQAALFAQGPLAHAYGAALAAAHVPVTRTDPAALIAKGFAALAARFVQPG